MKKHLHKMAQYTALILLSATSFPMIAMADDVNKKQIEYIAGDDLEEKSVTVKDKTSE